MQFSNWQCQWIIYCDTYVNLIKKQSRVGHKTSEPLLLAIQLGCYAIEILTILLDLLLLLKENLFGNGQKRLMQNLDQPAEIYVGRLCSLSVSLFFFQFDMH